MSNVKRRSTQSKPPQRPAQKRKQRSYAPYPQTKIDVNSAMTVSFVSPNLAAMVPLAGDIIDDETGLMNVYADTTSVTAHFFLNGQLLEAGSEVNDGWVGVGGKGGYVLLWVFWVVTTIPIHDHVLGL